MLLSFSPFSSSDFGQFKQINSRRTIDNIQLAVLNPFAVLARSAGAMMPFLCCELHRNLYLQSQLFWSTKLAAAKLRIVGVNLQRDRRCVYVFHAAF